MKVFDLAKELRDTFRVHRLKYEWTHLPIAADFLDELGEHDAADKTRRLIVAVAKWVERARERMHGRVQFEWPADFGTLGNRGQRIFHEAARAELADLARPFDHRTAGKLVRRVAYPRPIVDSLEGWMAK